MPPARYALCSLFVVTLLGPPQTFAAPPVLSGPRLKAALVKALPSIEARYAGRGISVGRVRALRRISEAALPGSAGVDVAYELRLPTKSGTLTNVKTVRLDEATGAPVGFPIRYASSDDGVSMALGTLRPGDRFQPNAGQSLLQTRGLSNSGRSQIIDMFLESGVRRVSVSLDTGKASIIPIPSAK